MNLTKIIVSVAVAGAITFGMTTSALAFSSYPLVKLNISGSLTYTANAYLTNSSLPPAQKVPLKKVSFDTKSIIAKFNASSTVSNSVFAYTGATSIPSGSYFIWDIYDDDLYLTNKNGFLFPLYVNDGTFDWDYGYLEVDESHLIGTYKYKSPWILSGSEKDSTGIYFYIYDDGDNDSYFEVELYGVGTLNWTYGTPSGGNQTASLSVSITGDSNDDSYVNGFEAIPISFSASGSGNLASMPVSNQPFFYEY